MITEPPTLITERLVLRAQQASDFDECVAMWNDPDVVRHIGGTTRPAQDVWFTLARSRGMWPLLGYGFWHVYFKKPKPCEDGSYCARPESSRLTQLALWIATALVILATSIDFWAPFFY